VVKNMEATIYNKKGEKAGTLTLSERVFGEKWNPDLVHQVVVSVQANRRAPFAHTKGRGDVRGGGKKPWRQKGTGRARHGSRRSPIWKGGGVTFGPTKDRVYTKKINKKMKTKALYSVLSKKLKDGEVMFVDGLQFEKPNTKEAKEILKSLGSVKGFDSLSTKRKNAAFISFGGKKEENINAIKSFNNFSNIEIGKTEALTPESLLSYKYLIMSSPEEGVKALEAKTL